MCVCVGGGVDGWEKGKEGEKGERGDRRERIGKCWVGM